MAYIVRHANVFDLLSISASRGKQRVLRLDPPYSLVQPEALLTNLLKSQLPLRSRWDYVYIYREGGRILGWLQARSHWQRRDEWTISLLGAPDRVSAHIWERLLEDVIQAAGEQGVIRLFVKLPDDAPQLQTFRSLGFTLYTNEEIWGNLFFGPSSVEKEDDPLRKVLRNRQGRDAWNLMQLYSAVTPPVVQRAEMLTSRQWQMNHITRPLGLARGLLEKSYVWQDESGRGDGLGGYVRLLTGASGHWVTLMNRADPGNRQVAPAALDHALWKAVRQGHKPVYCGVREYQSEVGTLLEERGFHLLSKQALLVKYLAEPIKEKQPALAPFLVQTGELVGTK
ncbi:MAG TPA: hypothetical protein VLQ48_10475 [Chloroflexia bacterium]|nr:hypothetical protein [Chloroflexia bacterium]